jgi:hypothetical protein
MKCWVVSLIMFLGSLQAFSQQEYFIYLQTDNHQPFYVRFNNKTYSSAASGYLVISKLPDSTCNITIGFPRNIFPEQQFSIPVNRRDAGFSLTNQGDRGWGLLNLQTLAVIMNSNPVQEKKSPEITGNKSNNSFAILLANVVNDTAILYTVSRPKPILIDPAIALKEEKRKDSIALAKKAAAEKDSLALVKRNLPKTDTLSVVKNNSLKNKKTVVPVKKSGTRQNPAVTKTSLPKNDTATVARKNIPAEKMPAKADSAVIAKNKSLKKDSIIVKIPQPKNKNEAALAKNNKTKGDTTAVAKRTIPKNAIVVVVPKNRPAVKDTSLPARTKIRDSSSVVKNDTVKKDTTATVYVRPKTDSGITAYKTGNLPVKVKLPITKAAELLTDTSYIAVFIDESKEKYDTIRISIPFIETFAVKKEEKQPPKEYIMVDPVAEKNHKDSLYFAENAKKTIPLVKKDSTAAPVKDTATTGLKPPVVAMINSDCKETAWDSDIDKLRIKMLLVKTDEEKIILAKKIFKQKCFLVKQVKALSELFNTDEGKYKWFDAVYSFVSDSNNFASLAELIKDDYYLHRFKAMLRN